MDPNETRARKKPVTSPKDRYARFRKSDSVPNSFLYLKAVDPHLLQDAIEAVTAEGNLISFTRTSDGNAICITITVSGERYRQYAANDTELNTLLESLAKP